MAQESDSRGPDTETILSLFNSTLEDLTHGLDAGYFTSVQLVRAYKASSNEVDDIFHAVIQWDSESETIAHALDEERSVSGPRSNLHGIPIILKDNIMTHDSTESTCGSTVLLGIRSSFEAPIVQRLRKAGVIILGKANMTEFAGFRSTNGMTAWSPRGGQATGIFYPKMKAFGSSSGSAISVGLGTAFASLGTETVSSIVGPAERSCVVGFKPTRDIVSSKGIIPVSAKQDTVGPMAKTVKDVAHILSIMAEPAFDYAKDLDRLHIGDLRIGVLPKPDDTVDRHKLEAFNDGLARLRSMGAVILDPVAIPGLEEYENLSNREKSIVLDTEFKVSLEEFLSNLAVNPRNIKTLGQLIEAIKHEPAERFPEWNVGIMERADRTSVHSPMYTEMRARQEYFASEGGIHGALETSGCDVLLAPAGSFTIQDFAAMAGSPAMSVPMGFYPSETEVVTDERTGQVVIGPNVPFSVYLYARRFGDAQLLRVAHAFESLTRISDKRKPYRVPTIDLVNFARDSRLQSPSGDPRRSASPLDQD